MPRQPEKTHLLDSAGYAYNFDRMMYINRHAKKAFSIEYIDDHPESVIVTRIHEPKAVTIGIFIRISQCLKALKKS